MRTIRPHHAFLLVLVCTAGLTVDHTLAENTRVEPIPLAVVGEDTLTTTHLKIELAIMKNRPLAEVQRLAARAKGSGVRYSDEVRLGKPAACLIKVCERDGYDLAVIGSPRPKGTPGLRSRMDLELLARSLLARLMTVPHPGPRPG